MPLEQIQMKGGCNRSVGYYQKMFNKINIEVFSRISSGKAYVKELARRAKQDMASPDKKGQAILEYGIIFVVVGLSLIGAARALKDSVKTKLDSATQTIGTTNISN